MWSPAGDLSRQGVTGFTVHVPQYSDRILGDVQRNGGALQCYKIPPSPGEKAYRRYSGFCVLETGLESMGDLSASVPLLSNRAEEHGNLKRPHLSLCLGRWVLKGLMWIIFITWVGIIFFFPSDFMQSWFEKLVGATQGTIFGITGVGFLPRPSCSSDRVMLTGYVCPCISQAAYFWSSAFLFW